ncbi:hypothetical protein EUTSA_v10014402mg [Eutrema salsugineum]|uniref:RRM domain-containing protein n=1 Tax=Eutrema salsugineum TaxID=72664 RepID=V4LJP2_EUTSA|nr:uncharacterized protein LOC18017094 isoform X2 [Eutrema salsugineum]ESQ42662.1 hypothetical protein EUTSA_v10014402mg [Eutrema salsugineum]
MDKRLNECSTSTDVETVHGVNKVTNPQTDKKRELDNLEIKEKRKKQRKHDEKSEKNEIKKLRKSYEEMTETMKKLYELIESRAGLRISFEKEAPKKKKKLERIYINECNFGNKDHLGLNEETLFVTGFDTCLPRLIIKSALLKHFGSCGKVTNVYVPIECATGASLGYAFINLKKNHTKGLTLSGSYLGGRMLDVMMAKDRPEFFGLEDFEGCDRCCGYKPWLVTSRSLDNSFRNWRRKIKIERRTFGSPYSKIGRFTASIARLHI